MSSSAGGRSPRKVIGGVSFEHPFAFWSGVALTTAGVLLQLPDFYASRLMHYRMAGMAVSTNMGVGMATLFVGVAVAAYGLFPRGRPRVQLSAGRGLGPLDDARLRPAHIALLAVIGIAVTIDVMKPVSLAFVAPGAAAEYGLRGPLNPHAHALPIGLYPLSGIAGTMVGSLLWGWMGDRIGRRASILLAAILFIATSTCATMPEFWMNLLTCFAMGLGAGGMLPIAFALLSETMPSRHRGWMLVVVGSDIAGAYILVSWLAATWASPDHFGWRLLWLVSLPTGLLLLLLNRWIPESPRYLLQQGRTEEARAVMARYGAVLQEDGTDGDGPNPPEVREALIGLTAAVVLLAISIGVTQYGFQQWMPSDLQRLGLSAVDASSVLRDAAIIGFPLSIPVGLLYGFWSSKRTLLLLVAVMVCSLTAFSVMGDAVARNEALLRTLLIIPIWGINIFNAVLIAYTAEVYPTALRARGSGISAGATKAGGVLILAFAAAAVAAPSIRVTAVVAVAPMVLATVALIRYGPETTKRRLETITGGLQDTHAIH